MKYGDVTFGQMEAVLNKLGGEDGVSRFLAGELVVKVAEKVFAPWMTIKLGTGLKDADAIRKAIADEGGRISDWANDILGQPAFTVATEETEVELVVVSVAELGFKDGAKYSDICERAKQLGLALCPPEVGPQLRLQYKDQPKGEWLRIAMEPITVSGGNLEVFLVEHDDDGLWLYSDDGLPGSFWYGFSRFVFVGRK